ncbi:MAG: thrombospondin type 3 repeat-containing protein [Deltaproteobacteria bacterium]|nr:thrombospondin type 3 repeat-containing protein [Deltaproteobacteria bacterium]
MLFHQIKNNAFIKRLKLLQRQLFIISLFTFSYAHADWKGDVGYTKLSNELGLLLPDGSGIPVCHVEAAVTVNEESTWMPDPDNSAFSEKTLTDMTGAPDGAYSSHATSVGRLLYGTSTSMAPGVTDILLYYAGHWMQNGYLLYGYSYQPFTSDCRLANHSWVGGYTDPAEGTSELLRRIDWAIDRDEYIQTVGINNNTSSTRPLLAAAFNVIPVGRTDGMHSRLTSAVDEIYTGGRNLPDIVAPQTTTSGATPMIGSAALLLMDKGHNDTALSTDPVMQYKTTRAGKVVYNAERVETIRAALMAGADRFTVNSSSADIKDYRLKEENRTANSLDARYGAGQVNIYNSYHIIAAGEQNSIEDGGVQVSGFTGFDYDPSFGGLNSSNSTATYVIQPDSDHNLLTAALVWHIKIDGGTQYNFNDTATLYNLDMELYDQTTDETIAVSASSGTNSEHIWVSLAPGHTYILKVKRATEQAAFVWDYGLAWRLEKDTDLDMIPDEQDNCPKTANRSQLDSDEDGYGNMCDCDLDNNDRVGAGDYWRWRLFSTINPSSAMWNADVDFNGNGVADSGDYAIFMSRYLQTAPYE